MARCLLSAELYHFREMIGCTPEMINAIYLLFVQLAKHSVSYSSVSWNIVSVHYQMPSAVSVPTCSFPVICLFIQSYHVIQWICWNGSLHLRSALEDFLLVSCICIKIKKNKTIGYFIQFSHAQNFPLCTVLGLMLHEETADSLAGCSSLRHKAPL